MATVDAQPRVGPLLREWRERRRLTQLELALEAGISTRHLSFVETGRSRPGRDLLLKILGQLEVPLREQNRLLLAVGHAPAFPERRLDDPGLTPVREALDLILRGHEPYPAVVVDRAWNLITANPQVLTLTGAVEVDPTLLEPPVNVVRLCLHPRGLAPLILDVGHWRARFRERLERQVEITGDEGLARVLEEVAGYPDQAEDPAFGRDADNVLGPLRLCAADGGELSFVGMFATFDAPFEVTASELAIELLFPADRATAEAFKPLGRKRRGP